MALINKKCSNCGSDDVVCDAWVSWHIADQQWVVSDIFDNEFCRDCETTASDGTLIVDEPYEGDEGMPKL